MDEKTPNIVDKLLDLEKNDPEDVLLSLMHVTGNVVKNDETIADSFYVSQFGRYLQKTNRGGLKLPGDSICQWVIYSYVTFLQSASVTCRSPFSNLAIIISDMYNFNVGRYRAIIVASNFFNNFCKFYSPRSSQELNQKLLKLSC